MGNLLPLDAAKKDECEEIAKDYLGTFSEEYVLAYGVEFIKMKMKQIENEVFGDVETKKKLMYRKDLKRTDPHKMGQLSKQGAIVKSWKQRHFVVNPDYSVFYYETEEAHKKTLKPKGMIYLAGYEVKESADNAKIEQLKALAKKLGLDEESLPLPEKFPPHTLALSHERRRKYYITAADEDDKKEWVEMFKTCCRKARGLKNEDPVGRAAFKTAYRRACSETGWLNRKDPSSGTEEQILTETLVEIINCRVLSDVYSDLAGNFTIKKKIQRQVEKVMDSMVMGLVTPAYKGLVDTTEKMKEPVEKLFNEKKDEIVEVQKKITAQIGDKIESIVDKVFQEFKKDIGKLYEDLRELTVKTSKEMRNECVVRLLERLVKDTRDGKNVENVMKKHYRTFENIIYNTCAWDHWYKVYNMEKEAIGIIDKYKETFDRGGSFRYVYDSHDMLALVADAAFFTFKLTMEERTKDNDILKDDKKAAEMMEKIKKEVISKYDHDSKTTPHDVSFQLTTTHVLEFVSSKIDPLTKDIRKLLADVIPEPLKKIISIEEKYELYLEELVKELIRRAIGISEEKETGRKNTKIKKNGNENDKQMKEEENGTEDKEVEENGTEDKEVEENGTEDKEVEGNGTEDKEVEGNGTEDKEVEENGTEDKEEEENDQEGGETGENEECENGNTDEEIGEEKKEVEPETTVENGDTVEESGDAEEEEQCNVEDEEISEENGDDCDDTEM